MSILSDRDIRELCVGQTIPMIVPYSADTVRSVNLVDFAGKPVLRKIISRGAAPFGYDVALASDVKLFTNINSVVVDPKRFDEKCLTHAAVQYDDEGGEFVVLPPNSYLLGRTLESFNIPDDVTGFVMGKSTYARAGIIVNPTLVHAGFKASTLVLEISNATGLPARIYLKEGIASLVFFRGVPCVNPYDGVYQNQDGVQLSKV